MTYELAIGDRLFSSWSLRGWLAFSAFGIDVKIHATRMYSDEFPKRMAEFAPARTVPALRHDGLIIADSLAIGEYLYERHPEQNLWPRDVAARATARMIVAEMHSSFQALRSACPMNLQYIYDGFNAEDAVLKDRDRIETLWDYAQRFSDNSGPWLFGSFSLADVFYAPIVMRFVTYGLASSDFSKSFCKTF